MGKHLLFAIFGLLLLLGIAFLLWQERQQEWKRFQRTFYAMQRQQLEVALQQVTEPQAKARLAKARRQVSRQKVAIKQLYIAPLHRTDRCITCHLGIDDPRWLEAEQPFTSHPPPLLQLHPPEKYGCTICHRGQGLATTRQAAHGQVEHWPTPLLPKRYLEASCAPCHQQADFGAAPVLREGRRLIAQLGCRGCHVIPGPATDAPLAPSLAFIGSKVRPAWLRHYLKDPTSYSPASRMPDYKLSDAEVEALTAYLMTLRRPGSASLPSSEMPLATPEMLAQGKHRLREGGCVSCHRIGGIPSPGFFAPAKRGGDLRPLARKLQPAWLRAFFTDRAAVQPDSRMPRYHFTDADLESIIAYLMTQEAGAEPGAEERPFAPTADQIATGRQLARRYNCVGCHEIPGMQPRNPAPPLVDIGDRPVSKLDFGPNPKGTERSLYTWLFAKVMTPRTFLRQTLRMPYFQLTMAQTNALVTFLLGQVTATIPASYHADARPPARQSWSVPGGKVGALYQTYQCLQCHTIAGRGNPQGPALTFEGSKVQKAWLVRYLQNPFPLRPLLQARMPNVGMPPAEAALLADYITLALVDNRLPVESPSLPPLSTTERRQGKRLFGRKYGCNACHQLGGTGGRIGPDLTNVATRLQPAWLLRYLQHPREIEPATLMPDLGLSAAEATILARYLWYFQP